MQEVSDLSKSTIGVESTNDLQIEYPEFILCLETIAMLGYSRHPYGDIPMTSEDKMERLLILMVGSDGSQRVENSLQGGRSLRKWIAPLFDGEDEKEQLNIPPQVDVVDDDTKKRLKGIFRYYSAYNESSSIETMQRAQFRMFCRECGFIKPREGERAEHSLIGSVLTAADVDVVYVQCVKHEEMRQRYRGASSGDELWTDEQSLDAYMNFDAFVDGIVTIAVRVKPELPSVADAVREVLRDSVFVNASSTKAPIQEPTADNETLNLFRHAEKPLHSIFDHYAKLRTGHTVLHYKYMTMEAFLKFARDFHIFPMWLSKPDLNEVFRSVCINNNVESRLARKKGQVQAAKKQLLFQFPEFVDALAMCALKALSREPYCEQYITTADKVTVFLTQMEACEAKQAMKIPMLVKKSKIKK